MAYPVQTDPTAVFGRRVVAALIDSLLLLVPFVLIVTASFEYLEEADLPVPADEFCDRYMDERDGVCMDLTDLDERVYFADDAGDGVWWGLWGATFLLFVVVQGLTGWTVGKLVVGIRTVREDGRPPGIVKALVRWLLWVVDGFPYFLPLVGFIVALTTVGHRRVGDMVAKTFVVRRSAAGAPIVVPGLTAPPPPVGGPGIWDAPSPDPGAAGWAAPTPPPAAPAAVPTTTGPQWDEARGTYIQWDPAERAWMQWNEGLKSWSRIPGQ